MRKTSLVKLISLLAVALALCGCAHASPAPAPSDVQALLSERADGVNRSDQQEYLSTVLPDDAVLMKEESDLIRCASGLGVSDYKAEAGGVQREGSGFTAQVAQSYTLGGQLHQCSYEALFVDENGKLYYDGPDFLIKQNDRVKVYYTAGEDNMAQQALDTETAVLDDMKSELGFAPQGFISVKIYADMQVFLESVKLDLPSWVGGWQEFGEAIKYYAGAFPADTGELRQVLNHESTHRMVSELSNDNASYWIQEGLASVFQTWLGSSGQPYLSKEEASQTFTSYSGQKAIDLEKLGPQDAAAVSQYYATSKAFAAFLLDTCGWDKVKEALEYMKKYPLIPVTAAEKMKDTNARTDDAMQAVLGFATDDAFQQAFDSWLEGVRAK